MAVMEGYRPLTVSGISYLFIYLVREILILKKKSVNYQNNL